MTGVIDVVFWGVSALAVGMALLVVTVRDVFRAALALAGAFLAVAGLFFLLQAEFIAVIQILVYVGAIAVVMVFVVLLTRDVSQGNPAHPNRALVGGAALMAVLFIGAAGFVAYETAWSDRDTDVTNSDAVAALTGSYDEQVITVNGETRTILVAPADGDGAQAGVFADSTGWIGRLLVRDHVMAFEALGALLLAALIGAIALVREPEQGEGSQ